VNPEVIIPLREIIAVDIAIAVEVGREHRNVDHFQLDNRG